MDTSQSAADMAEISPGSVWSALREQHREVTENTDPLFVADPVHSGVVFEFRYVPLAETSKPAERLAKIKNRTAQTLASSIETLLLSLIEIHTVNPDGEVPKGADGTALYPEALKPLADEGEPPMKFDERLCRGMGFPEGTSDKAAQIVRRWFGKRGDYLIIDVAQKVSEWFTETAEEVGEEFSGSLGNA